MGRTERGAGQTSQRRSRTRRSSRSLLAKVRFKFFKVGLQMYLGEEVKWDRVGTGVGGNGNTKKEL